MRDLFTGAELPDVDPPRAAGGGPRRPRPDMAHAAEVGSGPEGQFCRGCAHLARKGTAGSSGKFFGCGLVRSRWTSGPGTDIRAKDQACAKWEPKAAEGEEERRETPQAGAAEPARTSPASASSPEPTCTGCGASIIFAKTTKGKAIPLDAAPSPCGNVNLRSDGTAEVLGPATAQTVRIGGVALYLSHFVTCPKAATFRKPKAEAKGEGTGLVPAPSGNGVRAPLPPPLKASESGDASTREAEAVQGSSPGARRSCLVEANISAPPPLVAVSDGSQDRDGFAPIEGLPLPPGFRARDLGDGWTQSLAIEVCESCGRGTVQIDPSGKPRHRGCPTENNIERAGRARK